MRARAKRGLRLEISVAVLFSALMLLASASGAAASERQPTLAELEGEVMCPTCHTTLDQSDSPAARRIEAFISARIKAGDTKSEIESKLIADFGPAIMAAPPKRGLDLLAWWLPIAGLLLGALAVGLSAWRWSRQPSPALESGETDAIELQLEQRIDEELARLR